MLDTAVNKLMKSLSSKSFHLRDKPITKLLWTQTFKVVNAKKKNNLKKLKQAKEKCLVSGREMTKQSWKRGQSTHTGRWRSKQRGRWTPRKDKKAKGIPGWKPYRGSQSNQSRLETAEDPDNTFRYWSVWGLCVHLCMCYCRLNLEPHTHLAGTLALSYMLKHLEYFLVLLLGLTIVATKDAYISAL